MVKIDVISGFLGAGKTTLIKKLFESGFGGDKIVLIENEFGEIGIDGGFLKESGIEIKEINSGCICCSLVGDFATSMKEVIETYHPDRIIVEPSGVGKLSDIINAIKDVDADLRLNILATVVDGSKAKVYLKNFGEFFINQVDSADTVIINKVDKLDSEKIVEVVNLIKEKNPHANIITTPLNELSSQKLLAILEEKASLAELLMEELKHEHESACGCHHHHDEEHDGDCGCHHHHDEEHHHHHHHADEVFTSWGLETPLAITKEELENFLNALASDESLGTVIRAKGILKACDNELWYYFDYVSGDYEIRLGAPDYTGRVCVIGSKLDEHKIEELFTKRG